MAFVLFVGGLLLRVAAISAVMGYLGFLVYTSVAVGVFGLPALSFLHVWGVMFVLGLIVGRTFLQNRSK